MGNCLVYVYQFVTSNAIFKKKNIWSSKFPKIALLLWEIYLSPNILKNHQTIYKKARNVNIRWAEIFDCSKRDREICVKTIIPSQDTAFRFSSALNYFKLFGKISYIAWKKVKYVGLYNWLCTIPKIHTLRQ